MDLYALRGVPIKFMSLVHVPDPSTYQQCGDSRNDLDQQNWGKYYKSFVDNNLWSEGSHILYCKPVVGTDIKSCFCNLTVFVCLLVMNLALLIQLC